MSIPSEYEINEDIFFPIDKSSDKFLKVLEVKTQLGIQDKEFILLWNSRNIHRKRPADLILAYKEFCDKIGKENAKKCALVMHTVSVDSNGTNLDAVRDAFCDPEYVTVKITNRSYNPDEMNYLYNMSDACIMVSLDSTNTPSLSYTV
jgi:glycosyltransferase involved in cell wall biosynthesis